MSIEVQTFVLGVDNYPAWFRKLDEEKKVTYVFREDGSLLQLIIKNPNKYVTAKPGETLIKLQDDILVVTPETAEKYMGKKK